MSYEKQLSLMKSFKSKIRVADVMVLLLGVVRGALGANIGKLLGLPPGEKRIGLVTLLAEGGDLENLLHPKGSELK
jgi:hypothetical protein